MLFQRVLDLLNRITRILMIGIILSMSLILLLQIVSRFLVFMPLSWSQELLQYLNIWLVFLGAAVAVKEKAHIKVDFVVEHFTVSARKFFRIFSYLASGLLVSLVATQAYELMGKTMNKTTGSFPVPVGYFYLSLLVGCSLMTLNYVFLIYAELIPSTERGSFGS